jgi:hypothetical protein
MAVGKPDFNLNSFGIQYKEKRVKYFRKGDDDLSDENFSQNQEKISTVNNTGGSTKPQTPEDLATAKLNTSLNTPSVNTGTGASIGAGASATRRARNAAQPAAKPIGKPKPAAKPAAKPKGDKDTKYVFNAEQDPKTLSISQAKLLEDVNEARPENPKPDKITGITPEKRRPTSTTGVIANSANTSGTKKEQDKGFADPRKLGGNSKELFDTSLAQTYHPKGNKVKQPTEEKKEKKTRGADKKERETSGTERKMGSRMVGNAPPEVENTTEQTHSGKKVTVGVGSQAKEVFDKRDGVGAVHEETSNTKEVVVKPDKELNSITSSENNRLGDHRKEMDKFLKGATDEQRREYTAIADREDGREDHDAQRAYARNITGKQSKTKEKVTQTKEEKESERKQDHADRMVDMKERGKKIESDAESANEKVVGVENTNEFHGTEGKAGKVSRVTPTKEEPTKTGDNPDSSKAPEEKTEPNKITTDDINDKLGAIASKLALIKDPKEREKKRLELSGQKESDESKGKIEAARKKVEAAKKKIEAAKTKKETAKKKKVIPKTGQLTPAQVKAYKKEREAKKDVVAKSNDIIATMNILKLDLNKISTFKKPAKISKPKKVSGETWEEEGERVMDESISQELEDAFNRNE